MEAFAFGNDPTKTRQWQGFIKKSRWTMCQNPFQTVLLPWRPFYGRSHRRFAPENDLTEPGRLLARGNKRVVRRR